MPPHGASYTSKKWAEDYYLESIANVHKDYELVVACISPADVKKGDWITSFNKLGVRWVEGASMHDANALIRMRRLFSHFEYVTTNSIGSHVAYAAYCGAKVSIYGPYEHHDVSSLSEDALYKNNSDLLAYTIETSSHSFIKQAYGELFYDHPSLAKKIDSVGKKWLGRENIKHPSEIASLLGWYPHQQIFHWSAKVVNKIHRDITNKLRANNEC